MAKNGSPTKDDNKDGRRNGAVRDRSPMQNPIGGNWTTRDKEPGRFVDSKNEEFKEARRKILFPTEPSKIGHKKIDRAIERVVSRKK